MKILYLSRNDGTDMRVTKMCNSLAKFGHEVVFVGWDRRPDTPKTILLHPAIKQRIFAKESDIGKGSLKGWGGFLAHVIGTVKRERPDVVQAVNEEKALIVLPFKGIYFRYLIVDVFDSIVANSHKSPLRNMLAHAGRNITNTLADRIIETGEQLQAMLGRHIGKSIVISNCPPDPGEELSRMFPDSPTVRVCIGGSLSRKREQLDVILRALEKLPEGSVSIIASGWLYDDFAKNVFIKHPLVIYEWLDSPHDLLVRAATCDAILYLRGDANESDYRSWVLPNRFFDAMAVGRPIIVSSSAKLSQWVQKQGLGFVCPSGDDNALAQILADLRSHRHQLPLFAERVRSLFVRQWTWEIMENRLKQLYEELENA